MKKRKTYEKNSDRKTDIAKNKSRSIRAEEVFFM
jgi:hypothetical protein